MEADSGNADALYGLGVVAEGRGADARAVTLYEHALAADPNHTDASRKLRQHRAEAALAQRWGVYAYVLTDKSPLARKSLRLMESLRSQRRPSLVAYFGRYFPHFLVLGAALAVLAISGPQAESATAVSIPWAALSAAIGLFVLGVFCIRVLTTEVELDKGRLQIERGILNKAAHQHRALADPRHRAAPAPRQPADSRRHARPEPEPERGYAASRPARSGPDPRDRPPARPAPRRELPRPPQPRVRVAQQRAGEGHRVSGETGSAGWGGDLEAEVGLSAGLDFAALLGFESDQDDGGESSSVELADGAAGLGLDGGGLGAGFDAATDLLDVGEDLNDG